MARKKKKAKAGKKFRTFLVIVIATGLLAYVGLKIFLEPYLTKQIRTELNKKPGRLYDITFDDVDINLLNTSLIIDNLSISPNDSARSLLENGIIKILISVQALHLRVNHIEMIEFLKNKNVFIERLKVENAMINCISNPDAHPVERKEKENIESILPNKINSVNIEYFEFLTAGFRYSNVKNSEEPLFLIDSLSLTVDSIVIDAETIGHSLPFSFTGFDIGSRYISYNPMKYYTLAASDIRFDVQDTTLTIQNFRLIPKYSREEFNDQITYNSDWFDISIEKIILNGLNINESEPGKTICLNSIVVEVPDVEIYRDKKLPDAPFKHKLLITGLMQKIPKSFAVDTIKIKEGKLVYYERSEVADKPGKVFFDPLYLTAYNVTNDSDRIKKYPHLEIDFDGKIMGKSNLKSHFDFYLDRNDEFFTANGNLEAIEAIEFNQILEGLTTVNIQTGQIKSAEFIFKATDDVSEGELKMVYENLAVKVLNQDDPEKNTGTLSFLANSLVRNQNLPENNNFITGRIHFDRRKDKFIINYFWNSIRTGIISVVAPITDKNKNLERQEKKEQKQKDRHN